MSESNKKLADDLQRLCCLSAAKALEASDDIIREVANSYNMETPEGRRISGELAKIIAANRAALSLTRADGK